MHILSVFSAYLHAYFTLFKWITIRSLVMTIKTWEGQTFFRLSVTSRRNFSSKIRVRECICWGIRRGVRQRRVCRRLLDWSCLGRVRGWQVQPYLSDTRRSRTWLDCHYGSWGCRKVEHWSGIKVVYLSKLLNLYLWNFFNFCYIFHSHVRCEAIRLTTF